MSDPCSDCDSVHPSNLRQLYVISCCIGVVWVIFVATVIHFVCRNIKKKKEIKDAPTTSRSGDQVDNIYVRNF